MEFVGLTPRAAQLAGSSNVGQKNRRELVRALAAKPYLLLLDEAALVPQEVLEGVILEMQKGASLETACTQSGSDGDRPRLCIKWYFFRRSRRAGAVRISTIKQSIDPSIIPGLLAARSGCFFPEALILSRRCC